jgi:hypothetical protein
VDVRFESAAAGFIWTFYDDSTLRIVWADKDYPSSPPSTNELRKIKVENELVYALDPDGSWVLLGEILQNAYKKHIIDSILTAHE